jgi:hypothetical protein
MTVRRTHDAPDLTAAHGPTIPNGDAWRAQRRADRTAALLAALDGVTLNDDDRRIIDWLAGWESETVDIIASWPRRARRTAASELVTSEPTGTARRIRAAHSRAARR